MISGSLRNAQDGYTFFGIYSKKANNNQSVDFSFLPFDINKKPLNYGREFVIRYEINDLCYIIKDISTNFGYGTFIKLEDYEKIKDNFLINIGHFFLVFTFGNNDENELNENIDDENILGIKVFGTTENNINYFNAKQKNKITIGKNSEYDVIIDDDLCDVECVVEFDEKFGWEIYGINIDPLDNSVDGNIWISLNDDTVIQEGMVLRTGSTVFQCHLI